MIGSVFNEILPILGAMILWNALFQSNSHIGSLNFSQTIAYYILLPLVGSLTKSQVVEWLGKDIKDGLMSNRLLKPYNIWTGILMNELASKFNRLFIVIPIYVILFFVAYINHVMFSFSISGFFIMLLIITLGFALQFIMDKALVSLAFWLDEIWFLSHAKDIIFGIFGGILFPFDFLPNNLRIVFELLPFKYFYYTPISYLLGRRGSIEDIAYDLSGIFLWGILFYIIGKFSWRGGVKRYGAFGG